MQAKPPLACHANLVAEWGGVAAKGREREKRAKRVGVWGGVGWGGRSRRVHYVHRSATMNHPKSHPYFMRLNWMPGIINAFEFCLDSSMCLCTQHEHTNVSVLLYMSA